MLDGLKETIWIHFRVSLHWGSFSKICGQKCNFRYSKTQITETTHEDPNAVLQHLTVSYSAKDRRLGLPWERSHSVFSQTKYRTVSCMSYLAYFQGVVNTLPLYFSRKRDNGKIKDVKHLVERQLAGETLPQCHSVRHKCNITWRGAGPGTGYHKFQLWQGFRKPIKLSDLRDLRDKKKKKLNSLGPKKHVWTLQIPGKYIQI